MSHTTHFEDCGCLTARYEARVATLEAERDGAIAEAKRQAADWGGAVSAGLALADERRQLTAALEAERLHADALAGLFEPIASGRLVPWLPCKHAEDAMAMHAARRAAEKEAERD